MMDRCERILILGAKGQLGSALVAQEWRPGTSLLPATRDQLDLTDPQAIRAYIELWRPHVVINAAAYTAVDAAEDNPELAIKTNSTAVSALAESLRRIGGRLIQISTSDVFDGTKGSWYTEHDQVNPLSVYGRSMRGGELAALQMQDSLVVRTSWLYSNGAQNYVNTIYGLGSTCDSFGAVDDLRGCPTSAVELAAALVTAVEAGLPYTGLFHVAAPDDATWWDVSDEILQLGGVRDRVALPRLSAEECRFLARRPADARISSEAFAVAYGVTLSPWRQALRAVARQFSVASPSGS